MSTTFSLPQANPSPQQTHPTKNRTIKIIFYEQLPSLPEVIDFIEKQGVQIDHTLEQKYYPDFNTFQIVLVSITEVQKAFKIPPAEHYKIVSCTSHYKQSWDLIVEALPTNKITWNNMFMQIVRKARSIHMAKIISTLPPKMKVCFCVIEDFNTIRTLNPQQYQTTVAKNEQSFIEDAPRTGIFFNVHKDVTQDMVIKLFPNASISEIRNASNPSRPTVMNIFIVFASATLRDQFINRTFFLGKYSNCLLIPSNPSKIRKTIPKSSNSPQLPPNDRRLSLLESKVSTLETMMLETKNDISSMKQAVLQMQQASEKMMENCNKFLSSK